MIQRFYKKKIIRDFLSLYSNNSLWESLLSSIIEYGILMLINNKIPYKTMSQEDLIDFIEKQKKIINPTIEKPAKRERSFSNSSKGEEVLKRIDSLKTKFENIKIANKNTNMGNYYNKVELNKNKIKSKNKSNQILKKSLSNNSTSSIKSVKIGSSNQNLNNKAKGSKSKSKSKFKALEIIQIEKIKNKRNQNYSQSDNLIMNVSNLSSVNTKKIKSKIKNQIENDKKLYKIRKENEESSDENEIIHNHNDNLSNNTNLFYRDENEKYIEKAREIIKSEGINQYANQQIPLKNPLLSGIISANNSIYNINNTGNTQSSIIKDIKTDNESLESKINGLRNRINELSKYDEIKKGEYNIKSNNSNIRIDDNSSIISKNVIYNSIKPDNNKEEVGYISKNQINSLGSTIDNDLFRRREEVNSNENYQDDENISEDNFNKYNYLYMDDE